MDAATANRLAPGGAGVITLGGVEYLVAQPTLADKETLQTRLALFVRQQAAKQGLRLKPGEGQSSEAILDAMCSVQGVRFLAWLLIRKVQPEVRREDLDAAITEDNCLQVFIELDDACGMGFLGNSAGGPGSAAAGSTSPS